MRRTYEFRILGIFLVAFYMKKIGGHAVFIAAIIAEIIVLGLFKFTGNCFTGYKKK